MYEQAIQGCLEGREEVEVITGTYLSNDACINISARAVRICTSHETVSEPPTDPFRLGIGNHHHPDS